MSSFNLSSRPRRLSARKLGIAVLLFWGGVVAAQQSEKSLKQEPSPDLSTKPAVPAEDAAARDFSRRGWSASGARAPAVAETMTDDERRLVEMATARWRAIEAGKPLEAYGFLSPGSRAFKSAEAFAAEARASAIKRAEAIRAKCDETGRCVVHLTAHVALNTPRVGAQSVAMPITEIWLRAEDGHFGLIYK